VQQLAAYFSSKKIPAGEVAAITAAFVFKSIPKGGYFVEEGKTCKHLAFVAKGLFQYYYLKDGKEMTTYVSGENNFLLSLLSFYRQQPAKENIRAITDAECWLIHYDDLTRLKNESEAFRTFYIGALENLAVGMDETRTNLITLTAEERYEVLMKEEPALLQQIPLQFLASILGVTPRHLSRIRNNYR
jgi:CRP/FNR family transcriptional regulator, anaerobic regulatory protein